MGSYGYENEGWFDPWALMANRKTKAMNLGVDIVHGEVYNMAHEVTKNAWFDDHQEGEDEMSRIENRVTEVIMQEIDLDHSFHLVTVLFVIHSVPRPLSRRRRVAHHRHPLCHLRRPGVRT